MTKRQSAALEVAKREASARDAVVAHQVQRALRAAFYARKRKKP